jgi:hypothetical protein
VLVEFQAQHPSLDLAVTAEALSTCGTVCRGFAEARETLEHMLDAGHRYRNLEAHLGIGATFLLGTELPESW